MDVATPAVELDQVFRVLGRRKWLILLVVAAAVGATYFYSRRFLPPTYTATATVNIGNAQGSAVPMVSSTPSSLDGVVAAVTAIPPATMATYLWQATSPAVLRQAAADLAQSGVFVPAGQLTGSVRAANLAGTDLMTIAATGHSNNVARVANAVAQAFVSYEQQQASLRYHHALTFLNTQEANVQQEIGGVAIQLEDAQAQAASAVSDQQIQSLQNQLKELQAAYSALAQQVTTTQIAQAEAGSATNISIGAEATRPAGPTGTRRHVYIGLAFLVGLVGAAALAFLLEQLDHTVHSAGDLRRAGGLPTLAVIPYVRRG